MLFKFQIYLRQKKCIQTHIPPKHITVLVASCKFPTLLTLELFLKVLIMISEREEKKS